MTERQPNLFDVAETQYGTAIKTIVRTSDPPTSHEAAKGLDVGQCELIFLRGLRSIRRGATAYEVAAHQTEWPNRETIRKRAGGLKEKQLIKAVDRLGVVPGTGGTCERFLLTAKGLASIENWEEE